MACPPAELKKKSDELQLKWGSYDALPSLELFVEFAVCLSGFLQRKGLSGLYQMSHRLKQQMPTLFEDVGKPNCLITAG
ncbi:MAG: hypothetical protein HHJ17_06670 [Rhodoferax sp.]|uniref:hypothetical protein n=1 Tax=Rhodoferax sp. TaxID=50421 RepID=UPI00180E11E1|nr:hypothetical protein [Rhodoferax sp.]NMM13207.1 hypothetical protein [Rhodoferax sp.]